MDFIVNLFQNKNEKHYTQELDDYVNSDDEDIKEEDKENKLETEKITRILSKKILKINSFYALLELNPKDLNKLNFWFLNRLIDKTHVKDLKNKLLDNLKTTNYHSFLLPPLHIGVLIENDVPEFRIIDGQHRIKAIKNIIKSNPNVNYPNLEIYIYFCHTEEQLKDLFDKINNNKSLSLKDLPLKQASELILKMDKYYFDKYQIRIYKNNRPYLNQNNFLKNCEEINWVEYKVDEVLDYLKRYNRLYLKWCKNEKCWDKFEDFKKIKNPKTCFERAVKSRFALGINKNYLFLDKLKKANKERT